GASLRGRPGAGNQQRSIRKIRKSSAHGGTPLQVRRIRIEARVNMSTATPDELKAQLAGGLIPAVPVMFDRENHFHESAHEAYVSYMSSQPIAGVAVWAHTGRGLLLDDYTARRVMHEWRGALRDRPLIAGAGPRSNELNAALALLAILANALARS